MTNVPRKHHYVPKVLLRGFTATGTNEGQLHIVDLPATDNVREHAGGCGQGDRLQSRRERGRGPVRHRTRPSCEHSRRPSRLWSRSASTRRASIGRRPRAAPEFHRDAGAPSTGAAGLARRFLDAHGADDAQPSVRERRDPGSCSTVRPRTCGPHTRGGTGVHPERRRQGQPDRASCELAAVLRADPRSAHASELGAARRPRRRGLRV